MKIKEPTDSVVQTRDMNWNRSYWINQVPPCVAKHGKYTLFFVNRLAVKEHVFVVPFSNNNVIGIEHCPCRISEAH